MMVIKYNYFNMCVRQLDKSSLLDIVTCHQLANADLVLTGVTENSISFCAQLSDW